MRVNDRNTLGPAASETGQAQELQRLDRAGASRPGSSNAGDDRVEFSSSLGTLALALSTDGATRASRVQQLASSYQAGRYRPDSEATSRGIVTEALAAGHE